MNNQQPNFEKFKTIVYNFCINQPETDFACLGEDFTKSHHTKKADLKKNFNTLLDNLDIRAVGSTVEKLKSKGCSFPKWLTNKNYVIDYNHQGFLDLLTNG